VFDSDLYDKSDTTGGILQTLQVVIQDIDISNFFVCVVTTNPDIETEYQYIKNNVSWDPISFHIYRCQGEFNRIYGHFKPMDGKMQSLKHLSDVISEMDHRHRDMLFVNKSLCMMPWVGLNIEPDSSVRPCCEFDRKSSVGNVKQQTIKEIWNSPKLRQIRQSMLQGETVKECAQCYHKEYLKRDSLRNSINRDFARHVSLLDSTAEDGSVQDTVIRYWDIRYNNLCNFACRSCGPYASTSWYQIHNDLHPDTKLSSAFLAAGDRKDLIFDQICENIDHVEKIYFAGGEPLIIENFYRILELLDSKKRHDVHLVYNTNLSRLTLGDRSIIDLWKKFSRVAVGASLDAMGQRGEYLRTGTKWADIEKNRRTIMQECPHVDFWVSATTGLINALHVADFHRSWVDRGLICAENFNIQLLYAPDYLSVINAPEKLRQRIMDTYQSHLQWLKPLDRVGRAVAGFRSIIGMCCETGVYDADTFWREIDRLDHHHGTDLLSTFPELVDMDLDRPLKPGPSSRAIAGV
jgi:radical SAM protein with 4Fe4S-binding SPASM domain